MSSNTHERTSSMSGTLSVIIESQREVTQSNTYNSDRISISIDAGIRER